MDEQAARSVELVRAIESTDAQRQLLSDDDRLRATRNALQLAQWEASGKGSGLTLAAFLQKRAELILKNIAERTPALSSVMTPPLGWHQAGIATPVLALLAGIFIDRITDPHRVDLLSRPLLLIIAWNMLAYTVLLFWQFVPRTRAPRLAMPWLARLARVKGLAPRKLPQVLAAAVSRFAGEWLALSAALNSVRLKRLLHASAACFALGAVLSLYLRGLVSQYRAGWESTFLTAEQVHAILTLLFMPATSLFQLPGFSIAQVKALQLAPSAEAGAGALWAHLYAATLLLLVILPRLALALAAWRTEKKLAAHFALSLEQPYFLKLAAAMDPATPAVLPVFPYSFTVDGIRNEGLTTVARLLLGPQARTKLHASTPYGEAAPADTAGTALTLVLFNLSATPEKENHGAFLDHFLHQSGRSFLVMVDQSGYRERLGPQAAGDARMHERIALWRQFCELHNTPACIIDLLDPSRCEDEIERSLATPRTSR
ncbi:MAG: DUF2868 domain-containing protein [Polaromonas sp.]|nr:DUF2868 domain-containing protein [Polaromonas sp.]